MKSGMVSFYWHGTYIGEIPAEDEAKLRATMEDIERKQDTPSVVEPEKKDPLKEAEEYSKSGLEAKMKNDERREFRIKWELTAAYTMKDWDRVRRVLEECM